MIILPSRWAAAYSPLPPGWLPVHAPALLRRLPDFPRLLRQAAQGVGVAEHLLVTRCQLEQSALTYAWDGSTHDYGGGRQGDEAKLRYLCGADRTDSGDRPGGWFGPERQLLACALRFRWWYRGQDGPRPEWRNWLGLEEDPAYRPGVPVTRTLGKVRDTIIPDNQISADCLRYTTGMDAQYRLNLIAKTLFPEEFEDMSKSTLTQLDPGAGLEAWLRGFSADVRARVQAIVVHHTEEPEGGGYRGRSTIEGIRAYHQSKGWSDIGAQLYTCPDGTLYTGRPLDASNYSHAGPPWRRDVEAEARALAGGDTMWFNHHGLGIETVANFDRHDPWGTGPDARSLQVTLAACVTICRVFSLGPERVIFHRDVADKTCPGMNLKRADFRARLAEALGERLGIVLEPDHYLIPCHPQEISGALWVDLRPVAEVLGATVGWDGHLPTLTLPDGTRVDVSAWCVVPPAGPARCPLRQIVLACRGRVLEPLHLGDNPPRVYIARHS